MNASDDAFGDGDDGDGDGDAGTSDTMAGRVSGNRFKLWLLIGANRWAVTVVLLAGTFGFLVVLGVLDPAPIRSAMRTGDPVETLFQAYVTALITGVTLVVTINQVVLSQELGPVGDQRERMQGAMGFREDAEDILDAPVSPPEPSAFLRALVEVTRERADDLSEVVAIDDEEVRDRVTDYADSVAADAGTASDQLEGAQFGTFDVLFAALNFDYSWKIYEARRLHNEHCDDLDEDTRNAIDRIVEALRFFGPAREHFKTLYFQWELVNLSRAMLYAAVPALAITSAIILYLDNPGSLAGATVGVDNLVWVVSLAATVAVVPFMLLVAYVLRIATVAKRTLAVGPFVLRETERADDIDWGE